MNPLVSFLHLGQGLQRNQMWFSIFWSLCPLKTYILHSALFITFHVYLWGTALLRFRIQIWKIIFCVFEMFIIIPLQRLYSDRELHRDDPSHFCFDSITLSPHNQELRFMIIIIIMIPYYLRLLLPPETIFWSPTSSGWLFSRSHFCFWFHKWLHFPLTTFYW